jgi:hypothetical protein
LREAHQVPKRPEGWKPPPGVTFESALKEMSERVPGMSDHFERGAPGMHTSDTIDYGIVVRGEMTLELDDGQKVHLIPRMISDSGRYCRRGNKVEDSAG